MFSFLDPLLVPVHDLLAQLSPVLPAALMIVLITLAVRAALHPTNRRNQRLTMRRRELAPQLAELREKHRDDPQRLQREMLELHRREEVPLASGCLSILIQLPVFGMVYRLFTAPELAGHHNTLLDHTLLDVRLSERMSAATPDQRWVFFALIGLTLAVAAFAAWQMRRHMAEDRAALAAAQPSRTAIRKSAGRKTAAGKTAGARAAGGRSTAGRSTAARSTAGRSTAREDELAATMESVTRMLPMMSFMTVVAVASVPLAAGLYLVTSSVWGLLERASLRRVRRAAVPAANRQPA